MKGIILAGGLATRLFPATRAISKCLLPVYDRPMIYYPLSTLMEAGIKDILVITNEFDQNNYRILLGDGSDWGINIHYAVQHVPRGIADAFLIGEDFIDGDDVMLILGDNIFHMEDVGGFLQSAIRDNSGATVFGIGVQDPERFGVISFDENYNVISIEEKPKSPKSNTAVVGLYIYDDRVCEYAKNLKPSARGELEITDLNKTYLEKGNLRAYILSENSNWFDAGTHESLFLTGIFVRDKEREGFKISCPEKTALNKGYISREKFDSLLEGMKSEYYVKLKRELEAQPETHG